MSQTEKETGCVPNLIEAVKGDNTRSPDVNVDASMERNSKHD